MKPTVSVIVPIYNVEKYLRTCLDSLLNQTYRDIVVVAVDDGSPDNSAQILRDYMEKDERVKPVFKENGGYGSVLEYAIGAMETEYFIICDPDDYLTEDCIETLVDAAEKDSADIVIGDKIAIFEEKEGEETGDGPSTEYSKAIYKYVDDLKPYKVYTGEERGKFAFAIPSPHAKLYRTSITKDIKFLKNVTFLDVNLYLTALQKAERVVYIDKPLAYYLIDRTGNSMTEKNPKRINSNLTVWKLIYNSVEKDSDILPYIYYKLYYHLSHEVLVDYSHCSADLFHDSFYDEILKMFGMISEKKSLIDKVYDGTGLNRIIYNILTSGSEGLKKAVVRMYINYYKNR